MTWIPQAFDRTSRLYAIGFHPEGPLKIGYSTNPNDRLSSMRGACPDCLRLNFLGIWLGGAALELALHQRFKDQRLDHRDWFSTSVWDVEAAILELTA